ncbi:hypothetical protein M0R04_11145 [Candidatus Dojkabacteria bacterium]|jgi:hypothetical protein|nr:hypothetical protein [Candidatus Dojkabacteria bacterium]
MTKSISAEKLEEEKKIKDEKERLLVKEYKNNADRLKKIPYEIEKVKQDKLLTQEHINMQVEKAELQIKDLGIRENNFKVHEVKYDWELDPQWIVVQKDLLKAEIKALEFNMKCNKQSLLQAESNFDMQIGEIEAQEKRCFDSHKNNLKLLKEEHNWKPEQLSGLKKDCNYKCCR